MATAGLSIVAKAVHMAFASADGCEAAFAEVTSRELAFGTARLWHGGITSYHCIGGAALGACALGGEILYPNAAHVSPPTYPVAPPINTAVAVPTIGAGREYSIGLMSDGTLVVAGGTAVGQSCYEGVEEWPLVKAIYAGLYSVAGLTPQGTVLWAGERTERAENPSYSNAGPHDSWTGITAVAAGFNAVFGLRADGTIVYETWSSSADLDLAETASWQGVVAIAAGRQYFVAVLADGTVRLKGVLMGWLPDVSWLADIVAVRGGGDHFVVQRSDGVLIGIGDNQFGQCSNLTMWGPVVGFSAGYYTTIAVLADGSVLATGNNNYGQCDTGNWTGAVAVAGGSFHTLGLRADGTVMAATTDSDSATAATVAESWVLV